MSLELLCSSWVTAGVVLKPMVITDVGESYKYLKRLYERSADGVVSEKVPSPARQGHIINDLGFESAKGTGTLGTVKVFLNIVGVHKKLDEARGEVFVSFVQRAVFLPLGRHDIVWRRVDATGERPRRRTVVSVETSGLVLEDRAERWNFHLCTRNSARVARHKRPRLERVKRNATDSELWSCVRGRCCARRVVTRTEPRGNVHWRK